MVVGSSPTSGGGEETIPWARPRSLKEMEISKPIHGKNDCFYILRDMGVVVRDITVLCGEGHNALNGLWR